MAGSNDSAQAIPQPAWVNLTVSDALNQKTGQGNEKQEDQRSKHNNWSWETGAEEGQEEDDEPEK